MKDSIPNEVIIVTQEYNDENIGNMTLNINSIMLEQMLSEVNSKKFKAYLTYNLHNDCISVYFKDERNYSIQSFDDFDLFLSYDTNEIIGISIYNIKKVINNDT